MKEHKELHRTGLRPPTFRLSSLLLVVAVICTGLALLRLLDPMWAGLFLFFLLIIFAHLAGSVLGTQLRDNARLPQPLDHDPPKAAQRGTQSAGESLIRRLEE